MGQPDGIPPPISPPPRPSVAPAPRPPNRRPRGRGMPLLRRPRRHRRDGHPGGPVPASWVRVPSHGGRNGRGGHAGRAYRPAGLIPRVPHARETRRGCPRHCLRWLWAARFRDSSGGPGGRCVSVRGGI